MTNCKKFRKLIDLYLDGEADKKQTEELLSHLGGCAQCHRRFKKVEALHNRISSLPTAKLPMGFHNQIMANLQNPIKKRRSGILRPAMNLAGIAAAIILIVAIGWNMSSDGPDMPHAEIAVADPVIHIVSPLEEGVVDRQYVDISAAFNDIDRDKIRVILDTKDVTEATEINQEFLFYTSDDLQSGYHIATIQIMDNEDIPIVQHSWTFYVIPAESI